LERCAGRVEETDAGAPEGQAHANGKPGRIGPATRPLTTSFARFARARRCPLSPRRAAATHEPLRASVCRGRQLATRVHGRFRCCRSLAGSSSG
jgi:hypothetical protein